MNLLLATLQPASFNVQTGDYSCPHSQHIFNFEFKTGIRNKNLLLMNYLFPLGFYLMMGFIMPEINPFFRETMIPAMVTFAILAATLLGLPDPLVNARETGIFRSYKINGVPAFHILFIPGFNDGAAPGYCDASSSSSPRPCCLTPKCPSTG